MTSQYHLRRNLILVNKISHLSHIATKKYCELIGKLITKRSGADLFDFAPRVRDSNVANNRWRNVTSKASMETSGPHDRPPPCRDKRSANASAKLVMKMTLSLALAILLTLEKLRLSLIKPELIAILYVTISQLNVNR